MGGIRSFGDMVIPLESLQTLFRSSAMAKAFAEKLAVTARLSGVGTNGRLIFRPPWKHKSQREDCGSVAARLARTATGQDLFEFLRDCTLCCRHRDDHTRLMRLVWNNYIVWFNTAADARVPPIEQFTFSQPSADRQTSSKTTPPSGVSAVFPGDAIYSLRLTAGGVALGDVLGERPSLQQRS